jgi:flagellar hook-associated protein 1
MSLTAALYSAQSSLAATSKQTAVVSRNISGAGDTNYTTRLAMLSTSDGGGAQVSVNRQSDPSLLAQYLTASSTSAGASALQSGLDQISGIYSADNYSAAPGALIGQLRDAIQLYASQPTDAATGDSAVNSAVTLANALNSGSQQVQNLRSQTDTQIASSVSNLNKLLSNFQDVNNQVVNGTRAGADVSDLLDQRDSILKQMSSIIGVTTMTRSDNDMVILTDGGTTLFDKTARTVSFQPTGAFDASTTGNPVYVDGVPLSHSSFGSSYGSGQLSGLLQVRDVYAPEYQSQLDEIARSLVSTFSEPDQTGSGQPNVPGLFTWSGAPAVPASGTLSPGIAETITVNPAFIRSDGGSATLLRDGGAGGAAYVANTSGAASYTDRLQSLISGISAQQNYDPSAGLQSPNNLIDYASASVNWLEGVRQQATNDGTYQSTLASRAQDALSNATGVNIDQQMSTMLDLEHSYQASARVLTAVNDMLTQLMDAVK